MDMEKQIKAGELTDGLSFNERVWALTARIPPGKVTTYGEIARKLGTKAYRAVGNALNKNPYAPDVPCHRVVGANGALTGFGWGIAKKREMLQREGVPIHNDRVDLAQCFVTLD